MVLPEKGHNLKQREMYKRFWLTTMQQRMGMSHTVKKKKILLKMMTGVC
jgi:hypothetical protein